MYEPLRMQRTPPSLVPVIAERMRRQPGTISLGQGVVHYAPPENIHEGIAQFWSDSQNHKYKSTQGLPMLVDLIAAKLAGSNGIVLQDLDRIIVTAGSNMGFHLAILAITDPGDEIILPVPYFFNHAMTVSLAGCRVVPVPMTADYHLDLEALDAAITPRTRAIVTVSPNNPTGVVYREQELRAVNALCGARKIYHISDEAYEDFLYAGARHFSPGSANGAEAYTISLYTLSKSYGFAGWRIGYMAIPAHLVSAIYKSQDTLLICPPVISQFAAAGALRAGTDWLRPRIAQVGRTRDRMLVALDALKPRCAASAAEGAFYILVRIDTQQKALRLTDALIERHGVAVMPGEAFGMTEGCYLRIAYASLPEPQALDGADRLISGLQALLPELR